MRCYFDTKLMQCCYLLMANVLCPSWFWKLDVKLICSLCQLQFSDGVSLFESISFFSYSLFRYRRFNYYFTIKCRQFGPFPLIHTCWILVAPCPLLERSRRNLNLPHPRIQHSHHHHSLEKNSIFSDFIVL